MKAHVAHALALLLAIASPALAQTSGLPAVFQGGVPSGERTAQPLTLPLGDAVHRALEHTLAVLVGPAADEHDQVRRDGDRGLGRRGK